jgi:hypothetical protein
MSAAIGPSRGVHNGTDRQASVRETCGVCTASFIPAEDTGSRVLSLKGVNQDGFAGLLCGGCYSKWSHGTTMALRRL